MYTYNEILQKVKSEILAAKRQERLIIAIDGPDCSGKTTLSRHLCREIMKANTIQVVHFDDYANTFQYRTRRGEFSVEGFWADYFDEQALINSVLLPNTIQRQNAPDYLIIEGLFLLKPSIIEFFDYCIRLEIPADLLLSRALNRDTGIIGNREWVHTHYTSQCIPAQKVYIDSCNPLNHAHLVIATTDGESYEFSIKDTTLDCK